MSVLGAFDHAFLINRDRDKDRLHAAALRLAAQGIPFERFAAFEFEDAKGYGRAGHRGCAASHLACVREAQRRGCASVLLLEDDVVFRPNFRELWAKVLPLLAEVRYDLFYFYDWAAPADMAELSIAPIRSTLCTHCWAVHAGFYQKFVEAQERNDVQPRPRPIDRLFTAALARIYAPTWNLAGQAADRSRITGRRRRGDHYRK